MYELLLHFYQFAWLRDPPRIVGPKQIGLIYFGSVFSILLFFLFLPPFLLFFPPRSGPSTQAKGFVGALLASPAAGHDICSHQTHSLGSRYITNAFVGGSAVAGGCKCCPVSIKQNLNIEANVVSYCTVCNRVVAYQILRVYKYFYTK